MPKRSQPQHPFVPNSMKGKTKILRFILKGIDGAVRMRIRKRDGEPITLELRSDTGTWSHADYAATVPYHVQSALETKLATAPYGESDAGTHTAFAA